MSEDAFFLYFGQTSPGALLALLLDFMMLPGVGRRIAAWVERRSHLSARNLAIPATELPPAITGDPDWPLTGKEG